MPSTSDTLNRALQHHQAGQVTEAEQLYRQILGQQPDAVDALNFLGALLHQQGRFEEALSCFERVLVQQPNIPDAHNSVAIALRGQGRLAEAIAYYQQALELSPNHPEVLNNLANALRESGQLEDAIAAYERSLVLKPNYPEAHNNLGAALKDLGRLEEAIPHYREAMLLKPNYPEAHHNLGVALQRQDHLEEAIEYYRQAIALKPNFPEVYNSWGHALQQQGKYDEAVAQHQRAIDLKPDFAEAHHSLANALQLQKNLEAAIAAYQQALAIRPNYPEALNNLGNAYQEFGQPEQAIVQYQKALEFRPNFAEAYSNLGALLKDQRKLDEAIAHFQTAIELRPDYAEVHNNLGNAYQEQNKTDDAIACYRRALEINPELAETHSNLGNMLQQQGEFEAAFDHFQQALRIQPDFAGAYNNLGIALRNCNRIEEAFEAYDRAIELKPEFVEAHWNKALTYLLAGDLEQGFADYEWRFQWSKFQEQNPPRPFPGDRWDGSPLAGKTIFLHTEQGMGDAIQFIRYVPIVVELGGRVIVECHPPLVNLFQRLPGITEVIPYGKPLPAFDVHAPLMSLPFILGTTMATIPADVPYLGGKGAQADRENQEDQGDGDDKELVKSGLKIGLVWNGNPQNPYNRSRAVPLANLLPLAELPQVQLYSLQKEIQPTDLELLQAHPEIQDLREQLRDFVDTAAWIQQLDLIISVDTAVTHLAGALGKPVWLLLPFAPDWRWLLDREDSPWYPTMRLFRQPTYGDWDSAIAQVQSALLQKLGLGDKAGQEDRGDEEGKKGQEDRGDEGDRELVRSNLFVPVSPQGKALQKQQHTRPQPPIETNKGFRSPSSPPPSSSPTSPPSSSPPPLPAILKTAIRQHQVGRVREAEALCRQLVEEQPDQAEGWHLLGLIAHQDRRLEEAIAHYRRVLMLNPNHHDTYNNLAVAFHEQGRLDEAIPYYEKGLALKPDYADAHNNYANALREKKRETEALHHYQQAIALRPNYADAYNNLGLLLFSQEKYPEATECYQKAVELRPEFSAAHNHLGNALKELGDFEGAIQHYQQAIALNPNNAKAYNNWGNVFRDQGDLQTAIQYYERATAIDPQFPEGHWNKALTFLLGGDLQRGFAEYEWRWHVKLPTFQSLRPFPGELWDGSPLHGKTIFLHAEQGMGDLLQFVRYVAIVANLGGRIILECHQPLINLIKQLPHVQQVIPYGSPPPAYDVQAPLLSLPHILGTTLETVPADVPYLLIGDRDSREEEGERSLTPLLPVSADARLKVGLVWSGNPENPYNRSRAVPLSLLLTLAELPGIQLYSLQKDPTAADLELLQTHSEIIDLRHGLKDFVNTATLIHQLDLVISVDTAVTHLTGGLGRPVWLLLPFAPDWRWMLDRTDSPWYPTMRLFRQPTYSDWESAIDQVKTALLQEMQVGDGEGKGDKEGEREREGKDRLVEGLGKQKGKKHQKRQKSHQHHPKTASPSPQASSSSPIATLLQPALQHYQQGNLVEAERLYRQVLQQDPDQVEALHAIGVIVCQSGQLETAENYLRRVVTLSPQFAQAWGNLGGVVQQRGRVEEAIGYYQQAIALDPLYADAHQNLAVALQEQERLEEAIVHCQQAIALKPQIADLYYNLGFMLRRLNRLEEAIVQYRQAIQRRPDFVEAHKNLGHALLLQGKFPEGFVEYEWRWQQKHWSRRPFTQPEWDGSPLNGKTILLHAEQGFGDTMQFVRYATLVRDRGGRVIVEAQSALLRLLQTAPGIEQLVAQDTPLPAFDVHAPLLSLPRILGTTLDTVPAHIPYFQAPDSLPHLPISSSSSSLKVGITWMGNPHHKNNRYRSCSLMDFQSLFDLPDIQFYSLQKGEAEAELRNRPELPVQDLSPHLQDFADTAAAIAQLDLIITIDTSVAHLAGALGKPVWLLLSFAPDWRWMIDREDSPWYPTMRLFRQTAPGDWAGVFDRLKPALIAQTNHFTLSPSLSPLSSSPLPSSPPPLLPLTPPPSLFATPSPLVGLDWQLNGSTEWGILGVNLMLQLLQEQQVTPIPLVSSDLESLPPLYQAKLRSLTPATLDAHSWLVQRLDHTGILRSSSSANSQATQRIGIVMFTDTDWSSDAIAIAQHFDHLITYSTWNADILKQRGLSQVETLCWGIDPSLLHPAPKSDLFGDRFVIFSGGDLSYANGQDITIAAFKVFQTRHPEALLLTSWDGYNATAMTGFNQSGHVVSLPQVGADGQLAMSDWLVHNGVMADAGVNLGAVSYALLGQVIRAADVAIFPNRCQATSNPLAIAALACGIPTILSANTGHLDLIRHNLGYPLRSQGTVQPPASGIGTEGWGESDVEEVVETLERIYRDRQEALNRARSAVELIQNWTWERQCHRWIKLFHE
ncbi:tetratricopeptide repeat protein [Pantanalinema sp. GBBB05]|uniref:tetratricopeptide repeat protein n=1 Tax=Pantanalinema sp. GBBB05 TaxID=2604139 RepID=UPI003D81449C